MHSNDELITEVKALNEEATKLRAALEVAYPISRRGLRRMIVGIAIGVIVAVGSAFFLHDEHIARCNTYGPHTRWQQRVCNLVPTHDHPTLKEQVDQRGKLFEADLKTLVDRMIEAKLQEESK